VSSAPGARTHTARGSGPVSGPPGNGSSRPVPAAPAPGGRPEACPHAPPCPPPHAPGRQAARVIADHPEQGWSLLCNGVVVFDDTGALLPDGSVIESDRLTCWPGTTGTAQAGHARTVVPVPAGRAREAGLRRPGTALAGAALATSPAPGAADGTAPGSQQHPVRLRGRRVPARAVAPQGGHRERMTADAW
jgi:Family of unknown function (DUF5999)